MRNFQKKSGFSSFLQSTPVLALLAVVLLFFAYSMFGLVGKMRETAKNRKIVEDKVAELHKNEAKLNLDIARLNTAEGMEESVREKFGLVKEGEGLIVIVEDKTPPPAEAESKSSGFFSFFKNLFR